jgi:hypothetical protein
MKLLAFLGRYGGLSPHIAMHMPSTWLEDYMGEVAALIREEAPTTPGAGGRF